jgi:hypothetical protein
MSMKKAPSHATVAPRARSAALAILFTLAAALCGPYTLAPDGQAHAARSASGGVLRIG